MLLGLSWRHSWADWNAIVLIEIPFDDSSLEEGFRVRSTEWICCLWVKYNRFEPGHSNYVIPVVDFTNRVPVVVFFGAGMLCTRRKEPR